MILAEASAETVAAPATLFAIWGEMESWPEWNADTAWVRLDGPFEQGATGKLKPKGGPAVRFEVAKLTATEFDDVSRLLGARLTFAHTVTPVADGRVSVGVRVELTGPLRPLWNLILGADIAKSVRPDLAALIARAEARDAATAGRA
ncbi:SRPBCC family protein [Nocardia sp. NPDC050718]|uniref:SRPBCC family protein n=1 Tax=Nocardia sp. NPDC050718 TaxID=3155788 RepID=UPI0033F1A187